jgi:hypothetical protein
MHRLRFNGLKKETYINIYNPNRFLSIENKCECFPINLFIIET